MELDDIRSLEDNTAARPFPLQEVAWFSPWTDPPIARLALPNEWRSFSVRGDDFALAGGIVSRMCL